MKSISGSSFSICEFYIEKCSWVPAAGGKMCNMNKYVQHNAAASDKIQVIRGGCARFQFYERQFNIKFYAPFITMRISIHKKK